MRRPLTSKSRTLLDRRSHTRRHLNPHWRHRDHSRADSTSTSRRSTESTPTPLTRTPDKCRRTDITSDIEASLDRRTSTSPIPARPHPHSKDFTPPNPRFRAGPPFSIMPHHCDTTPSPQPTRLAVPLPPDPRRVKWPSRGRWRWHPPYFGDVPLVITGPLKRLIGLWLCWLTCPSRVFGVFPPELAARKSSEADAGSGLALPRCQQRRTLPLWIFWEGCGAVEPHRWSSMR